MGRFAIVAAWVFVLPAGPISAQQPKDTRLAEFTRERYRKVKMTVEFKEGPLRDLLKEFAHQVRTDAEFDRPVMWTYADIALGGKPIAYSCMDKPLETALNEICSKLKIGYFVIAQEDHPRDGWVRITAGAERGFGSLAGNAAAKPGDDDEAKAAARLTAAKELLDKGRNATARAVLNAVVDKYPKTKAAADAKALLEKLDK
jgi:hypothetical protein